MSLQTTYWARKSWRSIYAVGVSPVYIPGFCLHKHQPTEIMTAFAHAARLCARLINWHCGSCLVTQIPDGFSMQCQYSVVSTGLATAVSPYIKSPLARPCSLAAWSREQGLLLTAVSGQSSCLDIITLQRSKAIIALSGSPLVLRIRDFPSLQTPPTEQQSLLLSEE